MGKRGNQGASKATTKKQKVDPALASIHDSVKQATHLPDECSAMLANMLPFSLAIPADERADCQQRVVGMVEETLGAMKVEMETKISSEEGTLEKHKATMAELVGTVKETEATLAARKDSTQAAKTSLAEATTTTNASSQALAEQKAELTKCEANLAAVQEEKSALENAFQSHFRTPMEAGQGPHFKELEAFLKNMDIEKSMRQTLPGTCAKAKEDRGSFDTVILEQLEKTIVAKIGELGDTVTAETAAVAEREVAAKSAEADYNAKEAEQSKLAAAFEAAQKEQSDSEEALSKANEAVNSFRPQLEEATEEWEASRKKLSCFESGPFAHFQTYKTKTAAIEVATAGA